MILKIFVDFNNVDVQGRVRLNTNGSLDDIKKNKIEMKENTEIWLDDDEGLKTRGIIKFSESENIWVAEVDWDNL